MDSRRSPDFNTVAVAGSGAITSQGDCASVEACDTQIGLTRSPRFLEVLREIISANWGRMAFLVSWDLLAVVSSVATGYFLSPKNAFHVTTHTSLPSAAFWLSFTFIFTAIISGLYEKPNGEGRSSLLMRSACATVAAWALLLLADYVVTFVPMGRWIVFISSALLIPTTSLGRLLLRYLQKKVPIEIIVLGDDQVGRSIRMYGERRRGQPLKVWTIGPPDLDSLSFAEQRYINFGDAGQHQIRWIVFQGQCDGNTLDRLLPFYRNGTRICDASTFCEHFFQKVPVELIDVNWLVGANISLATFAARAIKRGMDFLLASTGLLLTLPLWPLIALAIKLSSKGPVFYIQERVGRHGAIFKIFKFRTMTVKAESEGKALWAKRQDSRVTPIGRFLRKTRLDEIPQFLNVLLGQMSFIGPRPERPEFVRLLSQKNPHYKLRHLVRPGITGWAQINYRYAASLEDSVEKLRYDLYYVKYGGAFLDLQILIRTVGVMMRGSR